MSAKRKVADPVVDGKRPRQTTLEETMAKVARGKTGANESQLRLDNLVEDIILRIASYLNLKDRTPLAATNRRLRQLTSDPSLCRLNYVRLTGCHAHGIMVKVGRTEPFRLGGNFGSYEAFYRFLATVLGDGARRFGRGCVGTLHLVKLKGKALEYLWLVFGHQGLQLRAFMASDCSGKQITSIIRSQESLTVLCVRDCACQPHVPRGIKFAGLQASFEQGIRTAKELPGLRFLVVEGQTEAWNQAVAERLGLTVAVSDVGGLFRLKAKDFEEAETDWLDNLGGDIWAE